MSRPQDSTQTTTSPSCSSRFTTPPSSTQDDARDGTSQVTANLATNGPLCDSDDDLSDAPENPVFPTFSNPSNRCARVPLSDSDSDLSDAPDSPVWPGSPKVSQTPHPCTEIDCPVRKATGRHYQGPYLYGGKPPRTNETIFGDSNPPPHVWKSWKKIQAKDRKSTVEDDWNVLGFLRYHVEHPNTRVMGI